MNFLQLKHNIFRNKILASLNKSFILMLVFIFMKTCNTISSFRCSQRRQTNDNYN